MSFLSDGIKLDDTLKKRILISHDPDDRRIDSEKLLHFIEKILKSDTSPHSSVAEVKCLSDFELIPAHETLGHIISQVSHHIICASNKEHDLTPQVMDLFDLLGHYKWDAKVVLVLAAFAMTYGELWLANGLYRHNLLAASVTDLRKIPNNSKELLHRFQTLRPLFSILTDLTKTIIRFCTLPMEHIPHDHEIVISLSQANTLVQAAAYWVIKATLISSSRIIHLVTAKSEVSGAPTATVWELTSLASRLSSICNHLKHKVETCQHQIELKLRPKLKNLHNEVYDDNQEVLKILLGMHDEFPLEKCASKDKPKSLTELKNKIVLLLFSTPDLDVETLFMLNEKLYQCHHPKLNNSYEIVWVPIPSTSSWSETDKISFSLISNSMPWWSIRRPWQLNLAAVEYIRETFDFKGQPIMPVLDTHGVVINSDTISMALIWGAEAFPFSVSREFELWKEAEWTLEFLLHDLDPLVSTWMEEGRNLCIFGGNDVKWIQQISSKMKAMIDKGLQVKIVYIGPKNLNQIVNNIFKPSGRKTGLNVLLAVAGLEIFWLRLESLKKSKLRTPGANSNDDMIIHQLEKLLYLKCGKDGWTIFGTPKNAIKIIQGNEVMECLTKVSSNVANLGTLNLISAGTEGLPPSELPDIPKDGPCGHYKAVAYTEELVGQKITCDHCHRTMELFFISE